ncbi:hypothetical protein EPH_0037440 [Eimeria praecox]|uniref:Chromo domain-containing protein n=1 Tax=Eimeria praecox TaxID=51316 RepID=U6G8K9_9EIME|nr:hypothetical protein EPH_0037440 [Eimeria praecox]
MTSKEAAVGWLPVEDPDGRPTGVYEVDYIMAQRGAGPTTQYLVKWTGAPEDRAIWDPASHLTNCPALLRACRHHHPKMQRAQLAASPVPASDALSHGRRGSPTPSRGEMERLPSYSRSAHNTTPPAETHHAKSTATQGDTQGATKYAADELTCS